MKGVTIAGVKESASTLMGMTLPEYISKFVGYKDSLPVSSQMDVGRLFGELPKIALAQYRPNA